MKNLSIIFFIILCSNINAQVSDIISTVTRPTSIAMYGDELYISELDKVTKINITDSNPIPVDVFTGFTGDSHLFINEDHLYIALYTGGKIVKMDLSLNNPVPEDFVTDIYGANGLIIKDDFLYIAVSTQNKISRVDLTQSNPLPIDFITGLNFPNALFIEGNDLYFIEVSADKISKVDLSQPQQSPTDVITNLNQPSLGLLLINDELYFSQYGANKISKININDVNPTVVDVVSDLNGPTQLILDNDELFVAVRLDDKISKIDNSLLSVSSPNESLNPKISLYPNPTSNSISIDGLHNAQIATLFSATGTKIVDFEARPNLELDLQNLAAGIYLLRVSDGREKRIFKVIKL